jgi:hypothetical protein
MAVEATAHLDANATTVTVAATAATTAAAATERWRR